MKEDDEESFLRDRPWISSCNCVETAHLSGSPKSGMRAWLRSGSRLEGNAGTLTHSLLIKSCPLPLHSSFVLWRCLDLCDVPRWTPLDHGKNLDIARFYSFFLFSNVHIHKMYDFNVISVPIKPVMLCTQAFIH